MRLAFSLRQRRRLLLMQLDPTKGPSSSSSSSHPSLKRPYGQQAHAYASRAGIEERSNEERVQWPSVSSPSPPPKIPRVDRASSPPAPASIKGTGARPVFSPEIQMPSFNAPSSSRQHQHHHAASTSSPRQPSWRNSRSTANSLPGGASAPVSRTSSLSGGRRGSALPIVAGEVHDEKYIIETFGRVDPGKKFTENPKGTLGNWYAIVHGTNPEYVSKDVSIHGRRYVRTSVFIDAEPIIVAHGDAASKKVAERLAALCAVYQLAERGILDASAKKDSKTPSATQVTLTDGTAVTFEQARQFMDYYCRRYGFPKPDVDFTTRKSSWEAVMTVGGRRIGIGAASNKKMANVNCYLDVTQYLEKCDPELWKTFLEAAKTGKDLGMAPKVHLGVSESLGDEIRDLCGDIKKSTLFKNRPVIGGGGDGQGINGDAMDVDMVQVVPTQPPTGPRFRAPDNRYLKEKSQRLAERRERYLADPKMAKMRDTRAALPVYARSADLLEHIASNEVTICMAATGSGKTTQIPQLILDSYIDRGEGAKCNIICTQPRRLAAISVADRVAKERNESCGRDGSIGYQVRFETKLPERNGSVTFCTTGIFLKRMQSHLLGGSAGADSRGLDDVTHVIVDEVHERDVDTDLLLVVLKRLLADRKARGKPLKIVLMSATIDPTLFQTYFPDDHGSPAKVIEIPGRSFPVEKRYLDDIVPQLKASPLTSWVFRDDSVAKYLEAELAPVYSGGETPRARSDDLELPYPLIALTISHVLQKTDDGHVLVFLPGWEEIIGTQRALLNGGPLGLEFGNTKKFSIHLLHSTIPLAEQQVIFEPPPEGVRRIILATNIAETSVTIPDVVYVVDTAKIKEQRYDPERHMSSLISAWVGSSNLNQRAGRAGRHRPGEYYGIIGQRRADALHPYQTVEMKRVDLSNVVMHVKALDFPQMTVEEVLAATIEPPAQERVAAAIKDLQMVGALDPKNNLTSLGRVLLQLPVEVQMGRLVLYGSFFRCLDQALTLAALLTNRDPFVCPMHLKREASEKKSSWTPQEFRSDALAALQAYNAWWALQSTGQYVTANRFCIDNFLSKPTLLMVDKVKRHLLQSLYHAGVIDVSAGGRVQTDVPKRAEDLRVPDELNANGDSLPLLAGLIAIASQPKFAIRTGEKGYRTQQDKMVFIHPSSVNNRKFEGDAREIQGQKQLFAFAEKRQNISIPGQAVPQKNIVTTTRLDPLSYLMFGAYNIEVTERGLECDDWLPIVGNIDALDDIQRLKILMEACMLRVFEGITMGRRHQHLRSMPIPIPSREEEEEESGDEDGEGSSRGSRLSQSEIRDLDVMTRDIVRILNRFHDEQASQSRSNSRPATPSGSPGYGLSRLPFVGSRSGYNTPYGGTYNSRPSTPSRLSRGGF